MYLTPLEESMWEGEIGEGKSYAMRVLVKYGEAMQAQRMVPISSAHVSFTSYRLMGEVGLEWLTDLVKRDNTAIVPTTTQVTCADMSRWKSLDISETRLQTFQRLAHLATREYHTPWRAGVNKMERAQGK